MAIDINTLTPASLKAKEVATEDYVDIGIASIDNSLEIEANNNEFALKLGYDSYAAMVTAAASGQTVINGGYINTDLIEVEALNAKAIVAGSVDSENITGTKIVGKNIIGGTISGTRIEGAIIKASYLDLDGEIQSLTNYYLLPSTSTASIPAEAVTEGRYLTNYVYNAITHDSIYDAEKNVYRIPSWSSVYENISSEALSSGETFEGLIKSQSVYDAGHNHKAVKRKPFFIVLASTPILTGSRTITTKGSYSPVSGQSGTTSFTIHVGGTSFNITTNHATGGYYAYGDDSNIWGGGNTGTFVINGVAKSGNTSYSTDNESSPGSVNSSFSYSFLVDGIAFKFIASGVASGGWSSVYTINYSLLLEVNNLFLPVDFLTGSLLQITCNSIGSGTASRYAKTSSTVKVDNQS